MNTGDADGQLSWVGFLSSVDCDFVSTNLRQLRYRTLPFFIVLMHDDACSDDAWCPTVQDNLDEQTGDADEVTNTLITSQISHPQILLLKPIRVYQRSTFYIEKVSV